MAPDPTLMIKRPRNLETAAKVLNPKTLNPKKALHPVGLQKGTELPAGISLGDGRSVGTGISLYVGT